MFSVYALVEMLYVTWQKQQFKQNSIHLTLQIKTVCCLHKEEGKKISFGIL